MSKEELYNKVTNILTIYEHPEEDPFNRTASEMAEDLYDVLVDVQNWMDEN